ncbi:MAG: TetR/AcrR family transcriptional regulator, partial [Sediminibacterium sp.]
LNTVDEKIKGKLKTFALAFLDWVAAFLEKGRKEHIFHFDCTPRIKALLIISNMLAILQLSRLTGQEDFENVKKTIKNELLKKMI